MKSKIIPIALALVIIVPTYLLSVSVKPEVLEEFVLRAGYFGPIALAAIGVLTAVFAPLSGASAVFAGYILYGPKIVFLFYIPGLISATINFFIARKWGRPLVERFVGKGSMDTVDKLTREHGVTSLLILRIFMGGVGDFVSYAMGLTSMKFSTYFLITVVGGIPGTLLLYWVALNSETPAGFLAANYVLAGIFTGIYLLYKFVVASTKNIR